MHAKHDKENQGEATDIGRNNQNDLKFKVLFNT